MNNTLRTQYRSRVGRHMRNAALLASLAFVGIVGAYHFASAATTVETVDIDLGTQTESVQVATQTATPGPEGQLVLLLVLTVLGTLGILGIVRDVRRG